MKSYYNKAKDYSITSRSVKTKHYEELKKQAEEEKRKHSARICAAIEQQILQRQQQRVIEVRIPKVKRKIRTAAEVLAEISKMEDEE